MGLCKCPKRQVTNQFCFEHRVNVCEHCMIQSHPKCIVQSYLQWLKDSDYVSNCTICSTSLDEGGEVVRLVCYHVFHWECLNAKQTALPANTAPRGHQCPICETEIFPSSNLVSPVADALKQQLSKANWGRNGLGLALLSEDALTAPKMSNLTSKPASIASGMTKVHHNNTSTHNALERSKNGAFANTTANQKESPHSVLLMDAFNPAPSNDTSSRRPLLPRQSPIGGTDRDDNKYARRTPAEIFSRWSRRFYAPSSRPPWRRTWFLVISGILAFVVLIYLMAAFGRSPDTLDDSWNMNPNPQPAKSLHYE